MRLVIRTNAISDKLKNYLRANNVRPTIPLEAMEFVEVVGAIEGDDDPQSPNSFRVYENDDRFKSSNGNADCFVYGLKMNYGVEVVIDNEKRWVSERANYFLSNGVSISGINITNCRLCGAKIYNKNLSCDICHKCTHIKETRKNYDWTFYKCDDEPENSVYYGLELEIVHKDVRHYDAALKMTEQLLKEFMSVVNWKPDFGWTTDGSLYGRGIELNFAPMTLKYYRAHESKFQLFFKMLSDAGFRGSIDGEDLGGIHIHRSNKDVDPNLIVFEGGKFESFNVLWYNKWFAWLVTWSGKSVDHFRRYSSGSYRLLSSKHGGNRGTTIEYRGYSSDVLLDVTCDRNCYNELDLNILWVEACCRMMCRPELLDMHPVEAVEHLASEEEMFVRLFEGLKDHTMSSFDKSCEYEIPISKYRLYELNLTKPDHIAFEKLLGTAKYFLVGDKKFISTGIIYYLSEGGPVVTYDFDLYTVTAITDNNFNPIHVAPYIPPANPRIIPCA
jgi:hypothetical protein